MNRASALRKRAECFARVRSFFSAREFCEVETPIIVPSPGLDLHLDAFDLRVGDRDLYLITSPEYQMKRLLAEGLERIFQITKCFRRGEIGAHHNPEFTMLEWYRANAGIGDVIRDTEELVAFVASDASAASASASEFRISNRVIDLTLPFPRMSICEAFAAFAGFSEERVLDAAARDEDLYFRTLVERVEPGLAALDRPIFIVDFPASQASLAKVRADDPRFCERFELYVAGIELCNGFGELTCPTEQRRRFERDQAARRAAGKPIYPIDERFLSSLATMPESGGNALGLDRLVLLALGQTELRDVISFPWDEL